MTAHAKGLLLTFSGVVLMSVESPLIRLSALPIQSIGFYFGIFLVIATNSMLLTKGKRYWIQSYTQEFKGILFSGFFMGLSNFCFISAVYYTGIANTVLILASSPIISALIAFLFLKQKTPLRIFIATFIVSIGLYIILAQDLSQGTLIGNLFAFGCVLSFSTLFVVLTKYKKASRLGYVSVGGAFVALFSLGGITLHVSTEAIVLIAIMGLFVTPLSRLLIGLGTRYILPAEVGLLVIGESVLAPLWGWWWLKEVPSSATLTGGAIILVALLINSLITLKTSRI